MSYLDLQHDPRRRATAVVAVGAIHAALGVALVTGFGTVIVDRLVPPRLAGEQIPITPPPPPPPPSAEIDPVLPTPPAPVPPIDLQPTPGPDRTPFDPTDEIVPIVPLRPDPGPTADPIPPRPAPTLTPRRASLINGPGGWIRNEDYPARALRIEAEGSAAYRLQIGSDGRVAGCEITGGTGHRTLDDATCRLITQRARFEPATDDTGARVAGTYSGTVTWRIPD